jgi:hypothetical protein
MAAKLVARAPLVDVDATTSAKRIEELTTATFMVSRRAGRVLRYLQPTKQSAAVSAAAK